MQLSPLFTGACGSPLVATILPSLTPTSTPQPVPQKRQGALPHLSPLLSTAASATDLPPVAAARAAAAALALMKSRLLRFITAPFQVNSGVPAGLRNYD